MGKESRARRRAALLEKKQKTPIEQELPTRGFEIHSSGGPMSFIGRTGGMSIDISSEVSQKARNVAEPLTPEQKQEREYEDAIARGESARELSRIIVNRNPEKFFELTLAGIKRWTPKGKERG